MEGSGYKLVVCQYKKTAEPQMAQLVFADTKAKCSKKPKSRFLPPHRLIKATLLIIKSNIAWDKKFDSINLSKIDKSYERNDWTIHKNFKK